MASSSSSSSSSGVYRCQLSDCPSYSQLFVNSTGNCQGFCHGHLWLWILNFSASLLFSRRARDYMRSPEGEANPLHLTLEVFDNRVNPEDEDTLNSAFSAGVEIEYVSNSQLLEWTTEFNLSDRATAVRNGQGQAEWNNTMVKWLNRYRSQSSHDTREVHLTIQHFPFTESERRRLADNGVVSYTESSSDVASESSPVSVGLLLEPRVPPTSPEAQVFLFSYQNVSYPPRVKGDASRTRFRGSAT